MEGTRIGNYRVVRLVGRGGMGAVYEAVHENLGKRAAIKVLHAHFAQDPMLAARFNNEARALTTMDHPGIVQVFDYGLVDGTPFIAMEFLNGEPLSRRLKRHHPSPLPLAMALRLCRQMASALASAHGHHVVHRDLKPGNVMIVADPEAAAGERVKLFDFGIAKLLTPRPSTDELHTGDYETRTGMLMGTPTYMSPEQCRGDAAVDDRTDVYALGVILYQMLAGRPPFYGGGDGEVIAAHIYAAPPALRSHDPGIPDEVEGLVYRLLAKQADARPRMAEVAAALEALGVKATGVLSAVIALPPAALEGQGVDASRRSPLSGVAHNPHTLGDALAPLGGPLTRPSLMPHAPGTLPSIAPGVDGMLAASARSGARPSWAPTTQTQRSSDSVTPSTLGLAQAGSGLEARPGRGIGRPPILLWALAAVGTLLPTTLLLQRECNAPPVAVSLPAPPQNPGATPAAGDKAGAQPAEKAPPVNKAAIDPAPVPEPAVDPTPVKPRPSAGPEEHGAEHGAQKPLAGDGRHGKRPAAEGEPPARVAALKPDRGEPAHSEPPKAEHPAESKPAHPAETATGAESKPAEPRTAPAPVEVKGTSPTPPVVDDKPRNVQTATMRGQKLGGELPSLPAALKLQVRERGTLVVSYRLCVDRAGHITSINRFGGSPPAGTDEVVHAALRGWSYRAQPYPVCFIETFRFEVD